ncbi:CDP-alcohol phosphatidyltransferase family protein [Rhodobium gokarnense]|uniref:CDP-diacylglycerol--glycerol-3-phosphate 3-phosphatidyltransferase n=1 Tax=Rhodobium gokarnense TaxID=364296 RepID=A0ABT3HFY1_9HYPH|nr:CDP-alcohol phosphatidyltransferase family protein [Rhodobium gokarnense]MCW2309181.1 cardiolipin synthase [Rhodobium gokarnense]
MDHEHSGLTVPNLITVARLFLVPVIVWLIGTEAYAAAFWLFVIAGVSDGVDGFIARHFASRSDLGAYLDPIADKALLVSIYIALAMVNEIPFWLVIAVVSRDVLIVGGVMLSWMMDRPVPMQPLLVSKANTVAQIVLASVVLADLGLSSELTPIRNLMVIVTAFLTLLSAVAYLVEWLRHMTDGDDHGQGEHTS